MTSARVRSQPVIFAAVLMICLLAPLLAVQAVTLNPGDIIVADQGAGLAFVGGLIRVDPATGVQTVIVSGSSSSGSALVGPHGVAIDAAGQLIVVEPNPLIAGVGGVVLRVDPTTGAKTIISSGPAFGNPVGVAIEAGGQIIVTDVGGGPDGRIIRVNPTTGAQTIISSGGSLVHPTGVAIDAAGQLIVAARGANAIIRVNPTTGAQTTISSGGSLLSPIGVAIDAAGQLIVAASGALAIIRVNPTTGAQTTISSGGSFSGPAGVAIDAAGKIIVADFNAVGGGAVIRVDPTTGLQIVLSSGGSFINPFGVAIVPGQPTVPSPVCDIQLNQTTFVNGDTLIAKVQVKNPGGVAVPAEIKVWASLPPPGAPVSIVNIGADGSLVLGPGFDTGLIQLIPPLPITAALPRGPYGLNCRILDPVTGERRAEDLNPFTIQ